MSYSKTMKHFCNHRKDKHTQPVILGFSVGKSSRNCNHSFIDISDNMGGYKLCLICSKVERAK